MTGCAELLPHVLAVHRTIRSAVLAAFETRALEFASHVARDDEGDTIYAIDCIGEDLLIRELEAPAKACGGIVLVAEGLPGGKLVLPESCTESAARFRVIVDPIDGTRPLMYQKRSAWVLTGVAPNRGDATALSDIEVAVQSELPLLKMHLYDELWALRGAGVHARRTNRFSGESRALELRPSRAASLEHGYGMLARFFPGGREVLAAIDDEIAQALFGDPAGKARLFEDQYTSTGGQLYELSTGRDRFLADLRPALTRLGFSPMCCHPYDLCSLLIAQQAGVIVTDRYGAPLDAPLDVTHDVAWVGYANETLRRAIEPLLQRALEQRGL